MSPLAALHHRLSVFRHHRQRLRWGMAWSALVIAVLAVLGALLAADILFQLSVSQRVVLLMLGLAAIAWSGIRFVRPWLGVRENATDVALFVERQHTIDSDLVAAVQFDQRDSAKWGSRELQDAVITKVARFAEQLNLTRGMDYQPIIRRAWILALAIGAWGVAAGLFPSHVTVFFQRLLLSTRHYPSDTAIESIRINGTAVWERETSHLRPRDIRSGKNRPLAFIVEGSGELPDSGVIECVSRRTGAVRQLSLRRAIDDSSSGKTATYSADLPRLFEPLTYTIRLGDGWTDPAAVDVIEPPVVDLAVRVTPPAYAQGSDPGPPPAHRQLSVLEGSRVDLNLTCVNEKPLASVTVQLTTGGDSQSYPMIRPAADRSPWTLPPNTPLSNVTQELRYEIQALDGDGLTLESPLQGVVRLKVDRTPTATAAVVHRVVLPTATPIIEYRLNDDYGIGSAKLDVQIERGAASLADPDGTNATPGEVVHRDIPLDPSPLIGQNLPRSGRYPLPLATMNLVPGDQLKLTLSVVDFRGELIGRAESSEPILIRITDEAGVLSAITEADERSDKRLDDVIKQQLGVGGNR